MGERRRRGEIEGCALHFRDPLEQRLEQEIQSLSYAGCVREKELCLVFVVERGERWEVRRRGELLFLFIIFI